MSITTKGKGNQVPPSFDHVQVYFLQRSLDKEEADRFYKFYSDVGWIGERGKPIRNWKTAAGKWIWNIMISNPYLRMVNRSQRF